MGVACSDTAILAMDDELGLSDGAPPANGLSLSSMDGGGAACPLCFNRPPIWMGHDVIIRRHNVTISVEKRLLCAKSARYQPSSCCADSTTFCGSGSLKVR